MDKIKELKEAENDRLKVIEDDEENVKNEEGDDDDDDDDDGEDDDDGDDNDDEEEEDDERYHLSLDQRRSLKLNKNTIIAIKDVFRSLDQDGSGTLEVGELEKAMKSMSVDCTRKELDDLMKQVDKDGNGCLDMYEFAQMVSGKLKEYDPEKDLKEAFAVFDQNGDGHISLDELRAVVESLGGHMTTQELEDMINEADGNSDGYLDYEEFVRIWMGDATEKKKDDESETTESETTTSGKNEETDVFVAESST